MVDVRNHGASLYSIETEPNMTPIRVLDSSNTVVWSWEDHEPFGYSDPVEGIDSVTNAPFEFNLRFPGQYYDTESGLVSNGFRDYSPLLGRYMEIDPMGLSAGMNPYGYVSGSPLDLYNPMGLWLNVVANTAAGNGLNDYNEARNWLVKNSPTAAKLFDDLEGSETQFNIFLEDPENNKDLDWQENNDVHWKSKIGFKDRCRTGQVTIWNPAILLAHELGYLDNNPWMRAWRRSREDGEYGNKEERNIEENIEADIYSETHNGDRRIRANHNTTAQGMYVFGNTYSDNSIRPHMNGT